MKYLGWFCFLSTLVIWIVVELYATDPLVLQVEAVATQQHALETRALEAELREKELERELVEGRLDCERQLRSANQALTISLLRAQEQLLVVSNRLQHTNSLGNE